MLASIQRGGGMLLLCLASIAHSQPIPSGSDRVIARNSSILEARFQNPSHDTSSPTWAKSVCQDGVWMHGATPELEWTPIDLGTPPNSRMVAVSGIALNAHRSNDDVWFIHPFGFDYNFNAVWTATPNYDFLAAPRYRSGADPDDDAVRLAVVNSGIENPRFIHVEMDEDFVPEFFRAKDGDSVAVFGRWIVDCGHDNYSSEIHPPLMVAKASANDDGSGTVSTLISQPFLVTQKFDDRSLFAHLTKQFAEIANVAVISPIAPGLTTLGYTLHAVPDVSNRPFSGIQLMTYELRPPRKARTGERLAVSYHFTHRTGVTVDLSNVGDDAGTISVRVVMNDRDYKAPDLPPYEAWHIPIDDVKKYNNLGVGIAFLQTQAIVIAAPAIAYVVGKGVDTRRFKMPNYTEQPDLTVFADQLANNTIVNVDNSQVYPIRGAVSVQWVVPAEDPKSKLAKPPVDPRSQVQQPPVNPKAQVPKLPEDPRN